MQALQEIRLIGPYFALPCLTASVYHSSPQKFHPELLQDVDMQSRNNLWLVHGVAPPHFLLAVGEFLNRFLEQWTRQGGPTV
jgi:hypothetical protein